MGILVRETDAGTHYFRMSRSPHQYSTDRWLFLTWSLHGVERPSEFPPPSKASAGQAFVYMDRFLDQARTGPTLLRQPEIATLVVNSFFHGIEMGKLQLGPFTIMPNHVHVLLFPQAPPSQLLHGIKGSTARDTNLL